MTYNISLGCPANETLEFLQSSVDDSIVDALDDLPCTLEEVNDQALFPSILLSASQQESTRTMDKSDQHWYSSFLLAQS